jgi:hypothetical protein
LDPLLALRESSSPFACRHANLVTEDLVKATENLISLLYQNVSIRNSKHSIRLSVSSKLCIPHTRVLNIMFTDISSVAAELGDIYFPTAHIHYRIFQFDSLFQYAVIVLTAF